MTTALTVCNKYIVNMAYSGRDYYSMRIIYPSSSLVSSANTTLAFCDCVQGSPVDWERPKNSERH